MEKRDTVLNLMVFHHVLLETLLSVFKDNFKKNAEKARDDLSKFVWELEKHFFVEEKAIFNFRDYNNPGIRGLIYRLEKEHTELLKKAESLKDISAIKDTDLAAFQEFLASHRETEERELYPQLDSQLSPGELEEIIARINEIPIRK